MDRLGTADTLDLARTQEWQSPAVPVATRIHTAGEQSAPLPRWMPRTQLPEDARTEGARARGRARIAQMLRLTSATDDETQARCVAAQVAMKSLSPAHRRLLLQHASRSLPLFVAIALGEWDKAAKLVDAQPVASDQEEVTRQELHVWLTLQTSNVLEGEPDKALATSAA